MRHIRLTFPLYTSVLLSLLAACSSSGNPGGGVDAGKTAAIGDSCTKDSDCGGGTCDTSFTGGYCVQQCDSGGGCPSGATCAQPAGESVSECLRGCTRNTDCRLGYTCDMTQQVCLPASTKPPPNGCQSKGCPHGEMCDTMTGACITPPANCMTAGCPSGDMCDSSTGKCVSAPPMQAPIGGACMTHTDCAGTGVYCLNFNGGYCSKQCNTSADCGSGATCVDGLLGNPDGGTVNTCAASCSSNSDCRSGYVCQPDSHACLPDCSTADVCLLGDSCDTATGQCQSGTAPGYPGTFPAQPQVENMRGGVLAAPKIVPIFFKGDNDSAASVSDIVAFYQGVGKSRFWQTLSEYGVGAPASVTPVMLNETAPTMIDDTSTTQSYSALQNWLLSDIQSGAIPSNSQGETLYVINYPSGTIITDGSGTSCSSFGGYHAETQDNNGQLLAYAVIPRCPAAMSGFQTDLQVVSVAASHELAEACTDPYPNYSPGWSQVGSNYQFLQAVNGGTEIGDMCVSDPEAYWEFSDFPFFVQRVWSNKAASAGHDPCVPAYDGEVYFNSIPTMPTVRIAQGQTGTVTLDLFSDNPTGTWSVQVQDLAQLMGGSPMLSFSPATVTSNGQNGMTAKFNVTVNSAGNQGTEMFVVESAQGPMGNQFVHLAFGVIQN